MSESDPQKSMYEIQYSGKVSKIRGLLNLYEFCGGKDIICCSDWRTEHGKCTLFLCDEETATNLAKQDWVAWIYPHTPMMLQIVN